jgi:hypothetical protein
LAGIALLVLLAAAAYLILFVPPSRQSHYGVSFVQSGYQTNAMGQAIPLFAGYFFKQKLVEDV